MVELTMGISLDAYSKIPVIIPAYQPDEEMIGVIRELRQNGVSNIIVVDDGSGAAYTEFFQRAREEYGCSLIHHAENLGKGRALKSAFNMILGSEDEILGCVTMDCRGSFFCSDILKVMDELAVHPTDLIMGKRVLDVSRMTKKSRVGNKVLQLSFHYLVGILVTDVQSGLRGIPLSYMRKLMNVKGERYEFDTNMLINCKKCSVIVREVPLETVYSARRNQEQYRAIRDNLSIYLTFATYIFTSMFASIVDLILFMIFCDMLGRFHVLSGTQMYVVIATAMARCVSATVNYRLNYRIVFRTKSAQTSTFAKWVILCIVQMAMSATAVSVLHGLIGGPEILFKIPVDFCLFFFSYYFSREFVYQ